ncbi:DUF3846 domain-containing protein [Paenibacillus sp.]|uniref:DUF3846 domain-containing protein n=1 Tax=Paenibacillus sp. TaxID=58172 RepID=UPI002D422035|nr:DUF3846 domain-containing protein [Paenibacillus sp.]HZG87878.1 DUF3846 domain-containing protein [Paenibacillus sp.]
MPKVLVAVPGEPVAFANVKESKESIAGLLGGPLECVRLERGLTLYCNGQGNADDLPINPHFSQGLVRGPIVIAREEAAGTVGGIEDSEIPWIMDAYIRTDDFV